MLQPAYCTGGGPSSLLPRRAAMATFDAFDRLQHVGCRTFAAGTGLNGMVMFPVNVVQLVSEKTEKTIWPAHDAARADAAASLSEAETRMVGAALSRKRSARRTTVRVRGLCALRQTTTEFIVSAVFLNFSSARRSLERKPFMRASEERKEAICARRRAPRACGARCAAAAAVPRPWR